MKHFKITILQLALLFLCSCVEHHMDRINDYLSRHGDDDYSIYKGAVMKYVGTKDSLSYITGIIPAYRGDSDNIKSTAIVYNLQDSTIVMLERDNDAWIDSAYISTLVKHFAGLSIYEIYANYKYDVIRIRIDEDESFKSCLFRSGNYSTLKAWSKNRHWKNISGNWYMLDD